jgi:segregation and condensation protein B
MEINEIKPIIDALIFASESPLSTARMKQIFDETNPDEVSTKDIKTAITELNADNREQQRGYFLQEVAGGYQYRTRPNYALWVKKLKKVKPFRLTQSTMETLAIIAYNQPIIRAEIDKIRGVDTGGVIKNLLERNLIKIMGRQNVPGRPFLLGTTKRFLEVFGLEKLSDMPSLKDFDNLDESKLPTILKNKLSDRLQEDKTQLFEVSDVEESEEQNDVSLTDADIENNVDELASVQENISDENLQQDAETSLSTEEDFIPKTES